MPLLPTLCITRKTQIEILQSCHHEFNIVILKIILQIGQLCAYLFNKIKQKLYLTSVINKQILLTPSRNIRKIWQMWHYQKILIVKDNGGWKNYKFFWNFFKQKLYFSPNEVVKRKTFSKITNVKVKSENFDKSHELEKIPKWLLLNLCKIWLLALFADFCILSFCQHLTF